MTIDGDESRNISGTVCQRGGDLQKNILFKSALTSIQKDEEYNADMKWKLCPEAAELNL
ncbi:hypothetical protein J6590_088209 [Homalodisca vitripennis]|nr:hypothetical protein J6590_088209 [Homalodisca vitripennis]